MGLGGKKYGSVGESSGAWRTVLGSRLMWEQDETVDKERLPNPAKRHFLWWTWQNAGLSMVGGFIALVRTICARARWQFAACGT